MLRVVFPYVHLNVQWRKMFIIHGTYVRICTAFSPFVLASSEIFSYHNNTR